MRHGASVFLGLSRVNRKLHRKLHRKLRRGTRVILKRERRHGADGPAFSRPAANPEALGMSREAGRDRETAQTGVGGSSLVSVD